VTSEKPALSWWKAALSARFEYLGNQTRLVERRHVGPLQLQKALYPEGPSICYATILHPPGGLAGGDELDLHFHLGASAHAVFSTPSATKWYKTTPRSASQRISIKVDAGARLEWLPQENILFNESNSRMDFRIILGQGATALGWDMICLGRRRSGESWARGRLWMRTEFVHENGEVFRLEQANLEAGSNSLKASQILAGFPTFGTFWAIGPNCTPVLAESLECPYNDQIRSGATCLPGNLLLIRALSHRVENLRNAMISWRTRLRPLVLEAPPSPLRLWAT
jgi:urease accessory protein